MQAWKDIRSEAATDMRYLALDPWEDREKAARKDEGRPAMVFDELHQYVNQLVNEVRMNPHAVKVVPKGAGDLDKEAKVRADIIRAVEYKSNAKAAYLGGFENAVSRSYGYWRVTRKYVNEKSFEQELLIKRIPNPDNVLFDHNFKEADASDIKFCYLLEQMTREEFKQRWPDAQFVDFSNELMQLVPKWVKENDVQVAEYWEVQTTKTELLMLESTDGAREVVTAEEYEEALKVAKDAGVEFPAQVVMRRPGEQRKVMQYMTNGVEILEKLEWDGYWIPIIGCFGKEMYVDYGAGPERVLMSLVRAARDPYMFYCYLRSCEAEESAMTPKTPFIGAEGQFEGHEDEWAKVGKTPLAYLQYKPIVNSSNGQPLPPPQRQPFQPNFAAYEIAAEAARRAIQAAMGISPLPTAAQRQNEKSGVALERMQAAEQKGSYHFIDNFLMSLEHSGRVLNDLIDKTYDTPRDVSVRRIDGQAAVERVNDKQHPDAVDLTGDAHDVTINTGPSYESQREEAADFADTIAKIPGVFEKVGDLITRLRNLGPIGDEIAERLAPPGSLGPDGKPLPPQAVQIIQQLKQAHDQINAYAQQLEEELTEMKQKEQARVVDNEYKVKITKLDNEAKIAIAEINAKVQDTLARIETTLKTWETMYGGTLQQMQNVEQHGHEMELKERESQEAEKDRTAAKESKQVNAPAGG